MNKTDYKTLANALDTAWRLRNTMEGWHIELDKICAEHGWTRDELLDEAIRRIEVPK